MLSMQLFIEWCLIRFNRLFFFYPKISIFTTIWFNFRVLPFKQALKLPILMYGKWSFKTLQGKVIIDADCISHGMFAFGMDTAGYVSSSISTLSFPKGSLFKISTGVRIGQGVSIFFYPNSILSMSINSSLGDNAKIICSKSIEIGAYSGITWECQVMSFNSHYIVDACTENIKQISNSIYIGDYCWICNRTTIMPGTRIPNRTIVASNSLLSKDYTSMYHEDGIMLGGCPAKFIKKGVYRIYNREIESWLHRHFAETNDKYRSLSSIPFERNLIK